MEGGAVGKVIPGNKRIARYCVGMRIDDAQVYVERFQLRHRIVREDGFFPAITRDVREDRINFTVINGIVTQASVG